MFARATSGDRRNNRLFSECSREKMKAVIDVKGACVGDSCCFKGMYSSVSVKTIERFHSRGQQNKRKFLHKKRVQLPED